MSDLYEKLKRFQKNTSGPQSPASKQTPPETTTNRSSNSLPSQLLNIPGVMRGTQVLEKIQERDDAKKRFLATIGVVERKNSAGVFGYREIFCPLDEIVVEPDAICGFELSTLAHDESLITYTARDMLFLDTETTGLAGGTGTVPFLIGVGFFADSGFRVCQYLMRDYDEETAVLQEVLDMLRKYPAVSSYNGKRFDLPLLQSRFLLNRIRYPLMELPHLDLLYTARRFWKQVLPDCSLSTVESQILNRGRGEDIPGELIPYVYFDFLRGLRIERMRPVLFHNAEDIISLAVLLAKACRLLREPETECTNGWEWFGLGRSLAVCGMWEQSFVCLERAVAADSFAQEDWISVCKYLSLSYKRMGRMQDAVGVWNRMLEREENIFACVELAKFYEHTMKQYENALSMTEKAILICQNNQYNERERRRLNETLYEELLHRKNRLVTKNTNV